MEKDHIYNPHLDGDPFFLEAGPVGVLLVHGFTATTAEVRLLADILHLKGYTVAAPLLPGHFETPQSLNRVRWQEWVASSQEMYERLAARCRRLYVGGESTGALVALFLATELPQVAGVLAYAPALRLQLRPYHIALLQLCAPFIPHVPKKDFAPSLYWQGYRVNPLKGVVELTKFQREVRRRLRRVRQPLLVVQGRKDSTVHPAVPDEIFNQVYSTLKEVHWMEESAHCVAIDCQFDRVAAITLDFMARVEVTNHAGQAAHAHPPPSEKQPTQ